MTWVPGTYDPALHLYYLGTGNPNPVLTGRSRKGDNLYTCSIVALNVDTGKLAWYFQPSPHDTHDWDAAQTPVLIDAEIDGKPRKLLAQANRNGYFFLLDRTNGRIPQQRLCHRGVPAVLAPLRIRAALIRDPHSDARGSTWSTGQERAEIDCRLRRARMC